ncbi:MAG: DUF2291 domain-containing protein [Verrucomicrobiales bacterium]|nr:DUF2291 domain-containing protein [Verrucomicrobiales bacterium]MCP5558962.1 DUF2291 domain-containing protein [Verrucomicrobiaceae bacterium]
MTTPRLSTRRRSTLALGALVSALVLFWFFPLFHVVPLKKAEDGKQSGVFNAESFAAEFWNAKLLPAMSRAVDLKELLAALDKDQAAARNQHGHTLGIGGPTVFMVSGSGKITAVEEDAITVALNGSEAKISLNVGLLFASTVRDATGLLDMGAYPKSQDFNDISTQLNSIVENTVSPNLKKQAAVGKTVRFAGCCELEEDAEVDVLQIVPIQVEWP